jgi:hypothetical protein
MSEDSGSNDHLASYLDRELPVGFFVSSQASPYYSACFSTRPNTGPRMVDGAMPPKRVVFPWSAAQIQAAVRIVRKRFPAACKYVKRPESCWDLYQWFDGHDLWLIGIQNARCVLDRLHAETQEKQPHVTLAVRKILEEWALTTVQTKNERDKLISWSPHSGHSIVDSLGCNRLAALYGMDNWYQVLLSEVLHEVRQALLDSLTTNGIWRESKCSRTKWSKKPAVTLGSLMSNFFWVHLQSFLFSCRSFLNCPSFLPLIFLTLYP